MNCVKGSSIPWCLHTEHLPNACRALLGPPEEEARTKQNTRVLPFSSTRRWVLSSVHVVRQPSTTAVQHLQPTPLTALKSQFVLFREMCRCCLQQCTLSSVCAEQPLQQPGFGGSHGAVWPSTQLDVTKFWYHKLHLVTRWPVVTLPTPLFDNFF